MNRDVLSLVLSFFVDFSHARNLMAACSLLARLSSVSGTFAEAVRACVQRNQLQLFVRLFRVLDFRDPCKTLVARLFADHVRVFFPLTVAPCTQQVMSLMKFTNLFMRHFGEEAEREIKMAEDRPRQKRLREERQEQKRAAKRQRACELAKEVAAALQLRQLPIDFDHPVVQKYCNGNLKTMKLVYQAMAKLRTEQQALAAFQDLQQPEVDELRTLTPDERKVRLQFACAEHKQCLWFSAPVVQSFIDGTAWETTGFVCAALFIDDFFYGDKSLGIRKPHSQELNRAAPIWRELTLQTALKALDKDLELPSITHAWMSSARNIARHHKRNANIALYR